MRVIIDSGAIVGSATHVSTGPNDPTTAGGHGILLAPAYEIQVDAFLPQEYVSYPGNLAIQALLGPSGSFLSLPAKVYYAGDRRKTPLDAFFTGGTATFDKSLTYRLCQRAMVTALKEVDPDGSQEHEESYESQLSITGGTKLYLGFQIGMDGHLSPITAPLLTSRCVPVSPSVIVTHPSNRLCKANL